MGFSSEWELAYKNRTNISIWPWSDLISMFYHYFPRSEYDYSELRVLELGCGAGANIPFFDYLGAKYYSVEGSQTEVSILKEKFVSQDICVEQGDFSIEIPFDVQFDLVFDRGSVSHNDTADIKNIIKMSYEKLKPGGVYLGIDWFSTEDIEFVDRKGIIKVVHDRTFQFGGTGTYANLGNAHFSDKDEILDLFSKFKPEEILLKSEKTVYPDLDTSYHWNFAMRKL